MTASWSSFVGSVGGFSRRDWICRWRRETSLSAGDADSIVSVSPQNCSRRERLLRCRRSRSARASASRSASRLSSSRTASAWALCASTSATGNARHSRARTPHRSRAARSPRNTAPVLCKLLDFLRDSRQRFHARPPGVPSSLIRRHVLPEIAAPSERRQARKAVPARTMIAGGRPGTPRAHLPWPNRAPHRLPFAR